VAVLGSRDAKGIEEAVTDDDAEGGGSWWRLC
jgi:hypothetical protein